MSTVIEELVAVLGFDVRGEAEAQRFQSRLEGVATTASNVARRMAVFAAGIATAASAAGYGLMRFVGPVAQEFDNLANTASRLGVAVEPLQEMRHAAEQAGIGVQNFDVALRRFIRRSSEAAQGTGAAKDAFEELGIQLRDNDGNMRGTQELFGEVADAIINVESQADRLRLAFRFFDTDGAALVQMLENGSEGLEEFYAEARRLGIVMSEENVEAAREYQRELTLLQRVFGGLKNEVALGIMPAMSGWLIRVREWIGANREIIAQRLDQVLDATVGAIGRVGNAAASIGRSLGRVNEWIGDLVGSINRLTGMDLTNFHAFLAAAAGLLRVFRPWWFWTILIVAAIDDLIAYLDGANSVIGDFIQWIQDATGASEGLAQAIAALVAGLGLLAIARPGMVLRFFGQLVGYAAGVTGLAGAVRGLSGALFGLGTAGTAAAGSGLLRFLGRLGLVGGTAGAILSIPGDTAEADYAGADAETRARMREDARARAEELNRQRGSGGFLDDLSKWWSGDSQAGPNPERFGPSGVPNNVEGFEELRQRLEDIDGGLSQIMDLSIRPHDVAIDRSVDFQQSVVNNITQNVTGATAPAAAGQAAAEGTERAGRRAADIATQEPSLN